MVLPALISVQFEHLESDAGSGHCPSILVDFEQDWVTEVVKWMALRNVQLIESIDSHKVMWCWSRQYAFRHKQSVRPV